MSVNIFLFMVFSLSLSSVYSQSPLQLERERGFSSENNVQEVKQFQKLSTDSGSYRLPRSLIPSRYELQLTPIMEEESFASRWNAYGDISMFVTCMESTRTVTVHSYLLTINETFVTVINTRTNDLVRISGHEYDEEKHFYMIQLSESLEVGEEYQVFIRYVAPISGEDRMDGLYRSFYTDPITNEVKWIIATQLESVHARQMYPCMDEPDLKAVFEIRVARKLNYATLCNTEIVDSRPVIGLSQYMWDTCAPTVKMSTYLVAIVVSNDYDCTMDDTGSFDKPVQVCAPKYVIAKDGAIYGARISAKQINFLQEYFNIDYKLSKLDSVSVPHFGGGAMENWGLNLYREAYLLFVEGETSEAERARVSNILAHELTHSWLGNLVTNKWWSEMWLKEGFATYYSYIVSHVTDPEFETTTSGLLNDCVQYSMPFASRWDYGHPILQGVNTPTEIDLMFDRMAYEKAGSLIRMMEGFLTEPTLRNGLTKYLNEMAYKGAEQDDLFSRLTEQAHSDGTLNASVTVKDIMDTWTMQKSFPLLRVTQAEQNRLLISQEPFRNNDDMGFKGERFAFQTELTGSWEIPITLITQDDPTISDHIPKFWMSKNVMVRSYPHDTQKWILLNADGYGYFRVMYDTSMAALLQKQLIENHTVISAMSRSQLIDDYFNLAFQKYISIESALEFTKYLAKESEYVVWDAVIVNLRKTYTLISTTTALSGFRDYFLPRLEGALTTIGLEQTPTEKGAIVIHRAQLLDWACSLEGPSCLEYAQRLFNLWVQNPNSNPIPLDVQPVVYCAAVANLQDTAFNFVFDQYKRATVPRQQTLLLNAMACAKQTSLLNTLLEYTQNQTSGLQRSHVIPAIQRIVMNTLGRNLVMRFLNANLESLVEEFGTNPLIPIFSTFSSHINTKFELESLEFLSSNPLLAPIQSSLSGPLYATKANIAWMDDNSDPIKNWFETQNAMSVQ